LTTGRVERNFESGEEMREAPRISTATLLEIWGSVLRWGRELLYWLRSFFSAESVESPTLSGGAEIPRREMHFKSLH